MTWWRQVRRNEASSAVCSRRHLRAATPDRRQRQHCLDVAHHGRQMQQERKQSPEGLAALLKNVRRAGRQYVKNRHRKVVVEMTPGEVMLLEKYARRGLPRCRS